jgi:hypothetical protein
VGAADAVRDRQAWPVDVERGHEPDMETLCRRFADQSTVHADALAPFADRYGEDKPEEPERLHSELFGGTRGGGLGLLRDLRDADLLATAERCQGEASRQLSWLRTRMKQAAPQALVVAD